MSEIIIGRKAEQEILRRRIESESPELIAIYGRRRIGKTYLVRQYFNDTFISKNAVVIALLPNRSSAF